MRQPYWTAGVPPASRLKAGGTQAIRIRLLYVEAFAAAAAAFFVRIAEDKAGLQLFLDVIHLGAEDEHHGFRIDQHRDPLVLDDFVELALLVGIFERVAEAGAAARPHADAHADRRLAALGKQCL